MSCPFHPPVIHRRLTVPQVLPLFIRRIFKITGKASVVESLLLKSNRNFFVLQFSQENEHVRGIFRKVALLEISGISFLTGVSGLQCTVCNATKKILTNFFRVFWSLMRYLIRNLQVCRLQLLPLRVIKTPETMSTVESLFLRSKR